MAPTKLTESDKQDILTRYRQPEETTSTLASRYGVSNSTISRILKQNLSDEDYEILVQQKRSGIARGAVVQPTLLEVDSTPPTTNTPFIDAEVVSTEAVQSAADEVEVPESEESPGQRRRRKRSTAAAEPEVVKPEIVKPDVVKPEIVNLEKGDSKPIPKTAKPEKPKVAKPEPKPKLDVSPSVDQGESELTQPSDRSPAALQNHDHVAQTNAIEEILEEELIDEEDFDEIEDDAENDDDLDDDLDDDDELDSSQIGDYATVHVHGGVRIQVLPLSEAALPKTCYIVIDRSSELITRPLKDFADLGQIPTEEVSEKTLPIFDNHRVAKRFLRRMQRVVKVPDGKVFHKVTPYLQAKGITRLLIDGQVYSL
ncbi:hypothetical protein IQ268_01060 [Oculatella sp. LEGE 06141]|uniref:hypothetical protein n=1 Tax=Oculatella sp. LEGE 06141 TaxID=1828648 RepID=UPI00188116A8|nr:hypothetical protein [Oculatella sp. LEGE 06141]MBE9177164.1 hypothetical protein [Oculatella sp. LEGE 06141]